MSAGITHFNKVSGVNGVYAGANDAEVLISDASGNMYQAGTVVNATAAELDANDISAQTETVVGAGACSVVKTISKLALVGAGAVTLAAPDASMLGRVKVIEMTVDNGDVTLANTNMQGGSAGATYTFDAVGDSLVLVGGVSKWNVVGESAVTIA